MSFAGRVAVGMVAAVVLAGGGLVAAKTIKQNISVQQACDGLRSYVAAGGLMVPASEGDHEVVILGDSYTAGDGLGDRHSGWAYAIGKAEGWETTVSGVGSTGFTDGGYCGEHVYSSRIGAAVASAPDMLIVQGGLNDADASVGKIRAAADQILDEAKGVARVVIVGPAGAPAIPKLDHVEKALSEAAVSHGREYISASRWELEFLPDELHLTTAGHAKFAGLVADSLR